MKFVDVVTALRLKKGGASAPFNSVNVYAIEIDANLVEDEARVASYLSKVVLKPSVGLNLKAGVDKIIRDFRRILRVDFSPRLTFIVSKPGNLVVRLPLAFVVHDDSAATLLFPELNFVSCPGITLIGKNPTITS